MNSNENKVYVKIIAFNTVYNFVVESRLVPQNLIWI